MADRASHARHDRFAVAAAIGGSLVPESVHSCPACGTLHGDLLAIRTAIRHAWVPTRPRDLRLTHAADGRRRPAGWWRRLMEAVGTPRDTVTRPLALSFTSLGLVGLLLTAVPVGSSGAATSEATAPVDMHTVSVAGGTATPTRGSEPMTPDHGDAPLVVLSVGLLGTGGGIVVLRRRAAGRARAMR